ncbi:MULTISPECIES: DUF885 domain-containing protein [Nitrospirillum]|uniref:Uncharacterized protein (DUF885 family) n=1 Tax=Nitrospirillum amazonense TaxID=28077 RepID=A0A560FMU4_9PROT|nr:DUF885 domain-containing protein [Nitrospirillum amazonense]MEC4591673.1 DUF885 domain-containing protein [Nitrospirillum amazonense]TWB22937.1 uncharacterized protein (DUF885 family) [Nitrospirillum amazonense]
MTASSSRETMTRRTLLRRGLMAGTALVALTAAPGLIAQPAAAAEPSETEKALNAFFEDCWNEDLARDPQQRTVLGLPGPHDKWTIPDDAHLLENFHLAEQRLKTLKGFKVSELSPGAQVSARLFENELQQTISQYPWRNHSYVISQLTGPHTDIASFLITYHAVGSAQDAEDYVARLVGIAPLMDAYIARIGKQADMGVLPPAFAFKSILEAARNVITGKPFTNGATESSPLLADFTEKVTALKLADAEQSRLIAAAEKALTGQVQASFQKLISTVSALETKATTSNGVWALPDGERFYRSQVQLMTTLPLDPAAVHAQGLKEVAALQDEMRAIMTKVGFKGELRAFFDYLRTDKRFFDPATPEGRATLLKRATDIIDKMRSDLDRFFLTKPKAPIVVKAVEPFREKATASAFYEPASPDGSRPGVFYTNLYDMSVNPIPMLESLAYHEGIPGHHMQIAIAQEMANLPTFRRFIWNSAYGEGWALYAERFPKEYGYYQDPYSDAGRIASELFRAARLVLDTGIHLKRWTREQAIAYMNDNTANPEHDNITEIERYFVWPGQALAYKIGMNKILELREAAKTKLGTKFDIRAFHDTVLTSGSVNLPVLEALVQDWVKRTAA